MLFHLKIQIFVFVLWCMCRYGPSRTVVTKLAPPAGPALELVTSTFSALKMRVMLPKVWCNLIYSVIECHLS